MRPKASSSSRSPETLSAQKTELRRRASKRRANEATASALVLTIGHSTRTIDQFIHLLQGHGVKQLVDVRTVPRSRHNPQFNKESLPRSLEQAGIGYFHMPGLGGLRHSAKNSVNMGWRNSSFRGFADYMQTVEFDRALEELMGLAKAAQVGLMCAEAVPWRCHRSLIADALLVRGFRTEHIMSASSRQTHALTPFAKVRGTHITYPPENPDVSLTGLAQPRLRGKKALK